MVGNRVYVKCAVDIELGRSGIVVGPFNVQHNDVCSEGLVIHQSSGHTIVRKAIWLHLLKNMDGA
jgi:hypothetical protein